MTLKSRVIPCLDVKDGKTRLARNYVVVSTGKRENRRAEGLSA